MKATGKAFAARGRMRAASLRARRLFWLWVLSVLCALASFACSSGISFDKMKGAP
ncbi:MAG: hypothetical protein ACJ78Q_00255 [Chloroflexia bacterium]